MFCNKVELLLLHIMRNSMTSTAFCILFMNRSVVRFPMAFLAGRQLTMVRVAFGAGQNRMFSLACLQQLVCLVMTAGADLFALGCGIGDIKRGVHRVTGQTVKRFKCCHGTMVLMTFCTLGDATMFLRMAGGAFLFGMLADLSLQTGCNPGMAQLAAAFKGCWSRDGHQRLVRVDMTLKALHNSFRSTMGCGMASLALGHYLFIIIA